jgi:hypothetical protein
MRLRSDVKTLADENDAGAPLSRDVNTWRRKTIGTIISSTRFGVGTHVVCQSAIIGPLVVSPVSLVIVITNL